jgi:type 1 glutamine amidotransferase/nicotinamidase-related amidase
MSRSPLSIPAVLLMVFGGASDVLAEDADALRPTLRSREKVAPAGPLYEVIERPASWETKRTALIVIDVWDKHWCEGANRRVAVMTPRFAAFVNACRDRGVFVVHAPSDTMKTYANTPGRKLAQEARAAPVSDKTTFKWNHLDPAAEGALPIDDSDGGCDCQPQCKNHIAWKAQHPAIQIKPGDATSDNGREVYNLLAQRNIENVIVCGVHTNMCVLGRPFGIRQLRRLGKNVALVRDLTDTMYNPRMRPFVAHEKGTDLVIEHVEKYWAPTITSAQILDNNTTAQAAGAAQRSTSAAQTRIDQPRIDQPKIVFVLAEDEYHAKDTLPVFASSELEKRFGWKPTILQTDSKTDLPGLSALDDADLLVLYARRRTLPDDQVARFRKYLDAGKPLVALRTSSHAFQNWLELDDEVLGCNYTGHHGKGPATRVTISSSARDHPILRGVAPIETNGSLYKSSPLASTATELLTGALPDKPPEPVAWTNTYNGGRIFYTSLGHPEDFNNPHFRRLLQNGILWALDKPIPKAN